MYLLYLDSWLVYFYWTGHFIIFQSYILSLSFLVLNIKSYVYPHIKIRDSLCLISILCGITLSYSFTNYFSCFIFKFSFPFQNRPIFPNDQRHSQVADLLIRSVCFRTNIAVSIILSYTVFLPGNSTENFSLWSRFSEIQTPLIYIMLKVSCLPLLSLYPCKCR